MKKLLTLILLGTAAIAADKSHWVEIAATDNKTYIDISNQLIEQDYQGFPVLVVMNKQATIGNVFLVEYNCKANIARSKEVLFLDNDGKDHIIRANWKPADTIIAAAIKARVCDLTRT